MSSDRRLTEGRKECQHSGGEAATRGSALPPIGLRPYAMGFRIRGGAGFGADLGRETAPTQKQGEFLISADFRQFRASRNKMSRLEARTARSWGRRGSKVIRKSGRSADLRAKPGDQDSGRNAFGCVSATSSSSLPSVSGDDAAENAGICRVFGKRLASEEMAREARSAHEGTRARTG